jgi:hypothetical protein
MPAGPNSKGLTLSPRAARRMVATIKRAEATPQGRDRANAGQGIHGWIPGAMLVRSPAGGIPACATDGTPGSATCAIVVRGIDGKLVNQGTAQVLNVYPSSVGGLRLCWCCWWQGQIALQTEACPGPTPP